MNSMEVNTLRKKLYGDQPATLQERIDKLVADSKIEGVAKKAPAPKVPKEPGTASVTRVAPIIK